MVALTTLATAHVSRADGASVAHAESAYARGSLREANRLFLASLREPGHSRDELVRIHVHLGIIAGAMGAERTARAHFAIALAIDPSLSTPSELAGRDRSRFEQARPAHALALSISAPPHAPHDAPLEVTAHLTHAPPNAVDRIELACAGTALPAEPIRRGGELEGVRATVAHDACPGPHVALVATARNAFGGVLAQQELHVPRGAGAR